MLDAHGHDAEHWIAAQAELMDRRQSVVLRRRDFSIASTEAMR